MNSSDSGYCAHCYDNGKYSAKLESILLKIGKDLRYYDIEKLGVSMTEALEIERFIDQVKGKQ
jgi:hypothetical protein